MVAVFILRHTLIPGLLGAIVVALVMPIRELALLAWIILLLHALGRYKSNGQRGRAFVATTLEFVTMALMIVLAVRAPGKITDAILDRPVVLQTKDITVGELKQWMDERPYIQNDFPVRISIWLREASPDQPVHFAAKVMTLRDFVGTVESQTTLRHRFHSCGNGHTVLWGQDCSFGMSLADQR